MCTLRKIRGARGRGDCATRNVTRFGKHNYVAPARSYTRDNGEQRGRESERERNGKREANAAEISSPRRNTVHCVMHERASDSRRCKQPRRIDAIKRKSCAKSTKHEGVILPPSRDARACSWIVARKPRFLGPRRDEGVSPTPRRARYAGRDENFRVLLRQNLAARSLDSRVTQLPALARGKITSA